MYKAFLAVRTGLNTTIFAKLFITFFAFKFKKATFRILLSLKTLDNIVAIVHVLSTTTLITPR